MRFCHHFHVSPSPFTKTGIAAIPRSNMSSPARFSPPRIADNPTGWGPNSIPPQFKDMPYQPFSKSDRLGKVSDI